MPAAFLFFSVAMPFLYSSSVKGNTRTLGLHWHLSSTVDEQLVCNLVAVTRQGGFEAVGSLDIFLIVCNAFRSSLE